MNNLRLLPSLLRNIFYIHKMEIEIEKISKPRFTKKSLLLGLKFCLEKDVETRIFRNFWRKFFPKIKNIHIDFNNIFGHEIYFLFVPSNRKIGVEMNNEKEFWLDPKLKILSDMSDCGEYDHRCVSFIITIKSDF